MIEPSSHVHSELHDLAEIPLPDALWQRVEAAHRLKIRRRRAGVGIVSLALAAVIAMPLLAPLFIAAGAGPDEPLVAYTPEDGLRDIETDLHALDQALQAAYDRGASDAEVAPMWVAREALLAGIPSTRAKSRRDRI